ncbi:HK97-gp10 family putative phage morphogenesis protein [Aureibacillus halotolerans]|uniref:HK97 gp10 family phage protein n=1 Tax=Aureibacillus halotolerans TaxID=1508390 RepID=A0A4R6U469_9BACI|nr:HK97-gp10 family putative phage morphogenesis protein [Aureibacillus halotolerans]TDQ39235.1 HK97 gp10 family phage protein [Aureibacillus halotolerans]
MSGMEMQGMEQLLARLQKLGGNVEKAENRALKAGGEVVAELARSKVNRSDKEQVHIADNIKVSGVKGVEAGDKHVDIGPGKETAWRAKFLEIGTSKMPAYPFMGPSSDEGQKPARTAMSAEIAKAVSKL